MGSAFSRADAATTPAESALAAAATPEKSSTPKPISTFSAALSASNPNPATTPPTTSSSAGSDASESTNPKPWWRSFERSELPNPGAYEEINQDATLILRPNLIEGLSFNFNAPLSEAFGLGTAVDLGAKDRPGSFAFNANYYTPRLVMISRSTPADGRVSGRVFINHTPALTSKIIADVGPQPDSSKGSWDLDYRGTDSCSQLKFANGGIVAVSYLQSVTPWLALGGEGFYQAQSGFSAITAAAKYSWNRDNASVSIASYGPFIASYVHRINPRVAFATELFIDARTRDSHATFGYRFDLKSATVIGHVDSAGKVAATLEERINPALSLILSGELDHAKQDYKFGFGVNIGGG